MKLIKKNGEKSQATAVREMTKKHKGKQPIKVIKSGTDFSRRTCQGSFNKIWLVGHAR